MWMMKEVSYMRCLGIWMWSWSILWSAACFMRCVWYRQKDDVNVSCIFNIFQVFLSIFYITIRYEAPRVIWYDCVILYESSELCKREVCRCIVIYGDVTWTCHGPWRFYASYCGTRAMRACEKLLRVMTWTCHELWRVYASYCGTRAMRAGEKLLRVMTWTCHEIWRVYATYCGTRGMRSCT
jgi:hypothetical protein